MPRARQKPAQPPLYQRRGAYRLSAVRASYDDERHMVHDTENVLRQMEFLGVLTARQREAGEALEADYRFAYPCGPRDSLDQTPRGESSETDAAVNAMRSAVARISQAKRLAGTDYTALREVACYRGWVKRAALFLPDLLDRIASEVYQLPGGKVVK